MAIGETQLAVLLKTMKPVLQPQVYVFCSVQPGNVPAKIDPVCQFQEAEGLTLILSQDQAEQARLSCTYPSRMITLTVQSSLTAVGFLAAVTAVLADQRISVNPVSAYYHDHLFVPVAQAEQAMNCLATLAAQANPAVP